ncbi:MAG: hypothetical protein ACETWM_12860 [Candidatus Lokiarchaeia archaeon]
MAKPSLGVNQRIILIGGLSAVVSMLVNIVCIVGAVVTYTGFPFRPLLINWLPQFFDLLLLPIRLTPVINTGYSGWYMFVSELGIGPSAFIFNVGLIISGILVLPLFPCLLWLLKQSIKAKIGIVMGMITYISLIGVGLAPTVLSPLHVLFGAFFFLFGGIAIVLLSYSMLQGTFFSKAIAVYGFFVAVVDLIGIIFGGTVLEWIIYSAMVLWILLVGVQMILKRNVTEA